MRNKTFSLCFHRISDDISHSYPPINLKVFKRLILYLKKIGTFISIENLYNNKINGLKFLLTFDDAFYDFYLNAFPFLYENNIPVIQNIITNCTENNKTFWTQKLNDIIDEFHEKNRLNEIIDHPLFREVKFKSKKPEMVALYIYLYLLPMKDKDEIINEILDLLGYNPKYVRLMSWDNLNELKCSLLTYGSHTHSHRNLNNLNEDEIFSELKNSKQLILKNTEIDTNILSFPNGQFNEKVIEIGKSLDYKYFLGIKNQKVNLNNCVINRINVYNNSFLMNQLKLEYYFKFK